MTSTAAAYAIGAGGLALGIGAGLGMSKLVSDDDPTRTTGLEGAAIGLAGMGVLGTFAAMPALPNAQGGQLAKVLLGLGFAFGAFGATTAFTAMHPGERAPARATDDTKPSYGGIVARNTAGGAIIGGLLGGAGAALAGYANPALGARAILGFGAAGAVMVGAFAGSLANQAAHASIDRREAARIGTPIDEAAKEYVWQRDEDSDGRIDLPAESRTPTRASSTWVQRDGIDAERVEDYYTSYAAVDRSLNARTPGDSAIDWRDVADALREYDTNGTGGLDSTEQAKFEAWVRATTERVVVATNWED